MVHLTSPLGATSRGCLSGLLVQLAAMALVLGLLALIGIGAATALSMGLIPREAEPWLATLSLTLWISLVIPGAFGFVLWSRRRIGRRIDAIFSPLGLKARPYTIVGRQFHGELGGRRVDAYVGRGPTVEVFVGARTGTRLGLGHKSLVATAIAGAVGRERLVPSDPQLADFAAWPLHRPWAEALLADPHTCGQLATLLEAGPGEVRSFHVQPDAVHLTLRRIPLSRLDAGIVEGQVKQLIALADRAETLPPPAEPVQPSPMEQMARSDRGRMLRRATLLVGCFCLLLAGGATLLGISLALLDH